MVGSEINRRTRGKRWKTVGRNLRPLLFVTLLYGARARATLSYAFVSPLKCPTLMLHFPVVHQKVTKIFNNAHHREAFFGSIYVFRKLPTYPSPKLTLTLSSHLGQNDGLGEG